MDGGTEKEPGKVQEKPEESENRPDESENRPDESEHRTEKRTETVSQPRTDKKRSLNAPQINIVVGRRLHGKTFFALNAILPRYPRVVIFDPNLEYPGVYFDDVYKLIDYVDSKKEGVFRVRMSDARYFSDLAKIAFNYPHTCFCADESWRALRPRRDLSADIEDLIFRGRHRHCDVLLVAQRFAKIHIDIRSQYTNVFAFRQTQKKDIDDLEEISDCELSDISRLAVGEYYHISLTSETEKKLYKKG